MPTTKQSMKLERCLTGLMKYVIRYFSLMYYFQRKLYASVYHMTLQWLLKIKPVQWTYSSWIFPENYVKELWKNCSILS
jgi:hypothetical protein